MYMFSPTGLSLVTDQLKMIDFRHSPFLTSIKIIYGF